MMDSAEKAIYTIGAEVLSLPVFLTNLLVVVASCVIINSSRQDLRIATLLLGNIAFADMATPLSILFGLFYHRERRTPLLCAFQIGATVTCSLTSMCCIVLIAVDRYFFIVHSIRYDRYMTEQRARLLIHLSWLLGILFGFVPITVKAFYKTEQGPDCRFVTPENIDVMLISGSLATPLIVATFILYMAIYRKAKAVSSAPPNRFVSGADSSAGIQRSVGIQRLKTRSVIIVFLSSSCFLLTWGPYLVTLMIYGAMCGKSVSSDRQDTCETLEFLMASPFPMLGFLNSLINPIIFAWWHRPFTRALYEIFCPNKARKAAQARPLDISTIASTA
ncbi:G protein-coupled receptor 119 [Nesidiocoris tenuis]|uniref:G protein-coupled receptor 119 n=1 Tax=Nesidiocoris tenuis TaxID=355587 RepID=A0ABN7AFT2_9HEMI|nr:G protein-coupled receptor 119 [Nesidiocoris tenuis]